MHELTERELYQALEYAKSIDEENGKRIMSQFEMDQPILFHMTNPSGIEYKIPL